MAIKPKAGGFVLRVDPILCDGFGHCHELAPELVQGGQQLGHRHSGALLQEPPGADPTEGRAQGRGHQGHTAGHHAQGVGADAAGVSDVDGGGQAHHGEDDHPGEVAQAAQYHRGRRRDPLLRGFGQVGGPDDVPADGAGQGGVEHVAAQFDVEAPAVGARHAVGVGQAVPLAHGDEDGDDGHAVAGGQQPRVGGAQGVEDGPEADLAGDEGEGADGHHHPDDGHGREATLGRRLGQGQQRGLVGIGDGRCHGRRAVDRRHGRPAVDRHARVPVSRRTAEDRLLVRSCSGAQPHSASASTTTGRPSRSRMARRGALPSPPDTRLTT